MGFRDLFGPVDMTEGAPAAKIVAFTIPMLIGNIASLIIMIVAPLISLPMLRLLDTPASIIGWCDSYLKILFVGCIGSAYYNILSGVLRSLGDSVSALLYLVVATLLNIVLDYVFVAWFGMGVAGVALATIIAQAVSAALCLRRLMQMKDIFDMNREYLKPRKEYMGMLLPLAYLLVFLTRTPENPLGNSAMLFVSTLVSWVIGATLTFIIYKAGRWKKKALLM